MSESSPENKSPNLEPEHSAGGDSAGNSLSLPSAVLDEMVGHHYQMKAAQEEKDHPLSGGGLEDLGGGPHSNRESSSHLEIESEDESEGHKKNSRTSSSHKPKRGDAEISKDKNDNSNDAGSMRNIYVANLPTSVDSGKLRALFEPFGAVNDVKLLLDIATGTSRGIGFIMFESPDAAKEAIAKVHRYAIDGRLLQVRFAEKVADKKHEKIIGNAVYIRNIPATSGKEAIRQYFLQFGEILDVDHHPQSAELRGPSPYNMTFVVFKENDVAATAVQAVDGKAPFSLPQANHPFLVAKVIQDIVAEKRKSVILRPRYQHGPGGLQQQQQQSTSPPGRSANLTPLPGSAPGPAPLPNFLLEHSAKESSHGQGTSHSRSGLESSASANSLRQQHPTWVSSIGASGSGGGMQTPGGMTSTPTGTMAHPPALASMPAQALVPLQPMLQPGSPPGSPPMATTPPGTIAQLPVHHSLAPMPLVPLQPLSQPGSPPGSPPTGGQQQPQYFQRPDGSIIQMAPGQHPQVVGNQQQQQPPQIVNQMAPQAGVIPMMQPPHFQNPQQQQQQHMAQVPMMQGVQPQNLQQQNMNNLQHFVPSLLHMQQPPPHLNGFVTQPQQQPMTQVLQLPHPQMQQQQGQWVQQVPNGHMQPQMMRPPTH